MKRIIGVRRAAQVWRRIRRYGASAEAGLGFDLLSNGDFAARLTELRRSKAETPWSLAAAEATRRLPSLTFEELAEVANALAFGPSISPRCGGLSSPWPELVKEILVKMPMVEQPSLLSVRRSATALQRMMVQDEAWASCLAKHLATLEKQPLTEEESRSLSTVVDAFVALQGQLSEEARTAAWLGICRAASCCSGAAGTLALARHLVAPEMPSDPIVTEAFEATLKRAALAQLEVAEVALLLNAAARAPRREAAELSPEASLVLMTLASRMAEHLRRDEGSPRDAANALDALGRLSVENDELFEAFAEYLPNHLDQFGPKDVVGACTALGRLKERDEASLLAIAGLVSMDIRHYSVRQLAEILTAFARLRVRETSLLQNTMEHCAGEAWRSQAHRPEDAVALLSAWGRLQALHVAAIEVTSGMLMRGDQALESLGATDLREVMVAYARSRWACQPMLQSAADRLAALEGSHMHLLQMLAPALVALSRCRWPHPELEDRALRLLQEEVDLDGRDTARAVSLSAQALQGSALLGAGHLWLRACEVVAARLLFAGPDTVWAQLSAWKASGGLAPELWDEEEEEFERERCWERELLFGVLALAFTRRPSEELGQGVVACMPKLSAHVLLHLLLLRSEGLLQQPSLRPLCHNVLEAMDACGIQSGLQVHESGYRGRPLPNEAHSVAKVLVKLGGFHSPEPLRRPWIFRPAALAVHLILPSAWRCDEGFLPEE